MTDFYEQKTLDMLEKRDPIGNELPITNHTTRDEFLKAYPELWWCSDTGKLIVESKQDVYNEYPGDTELHKLVNTFNETRYEWARKYQVDDKPMAKVKADYLNEVHKASSHHSERNLVEDIKKFREIPASKLNHNPYYLGTPAGTFDLNTCLYPKEFGYYGMEYEEDEVRACRVSKHTTANVMPLEEWMNDELDPKWLKFIDEITCHDRDLADFLQRAFGYACFGGNPEEVMFVLYGPTSRNGKGVLCSAIKNALGDYAEQVTPNFLLKKKKDADITDSELASLVGTRVVFAQEPPADGQFDESKVKWYTGGDPIRCARKYGHPFTYTPEFTIFMACNELPKLKDNAVFMSRRVIVIPFDRHFSEDEQDITLKRHFIDDGFAIDSVLTWVVLGYLEYKKYGLKQPEAVVRANDAYRITQQNSLEQFLFVSAQYDQTKRWDKSDFVKKYEIFCKTVDLTPMTGIMRNKMLRERGISIKKSNGKEYYIGICPQDIAVNLKEFERELGKVRDGNKSVLPVTSSHSDTPAKASQDENDAVFDDDWIEKDDEVDQNDAFDDLLED